MEKVNSNGGKILGSLLGILAVIAGVYAMVAPMNQRIDFMERTIESQAREAERHTDLGLHPGAGAQLSAISERLKEVETQFIGLREVLALEIRAASRRLEALEVGGNPRHDERIKALESAISRLVNGQ